MPNTVGMVFPILLALAGILSLVGSPAAEYALQPAHACRYTTDMQPVVKSVARFIRDAPGIDPAMVNKRFTAIARTMAQVEVRDGQSSGTERIHALLFTAMSDVEAAVNLWRKYHDPDIANARVHHATRTLSEATARLNRLSCRLV